MMTRAVATNNPVTAPTCRQLFGCAREAVLADFAAYAWGQLLALDAGHRIALEFPGVTRALPQGQVRRGRRAAQRWLASAVHVGAVDAAHPAGHDEPHLIDVGAGTFRT
jgi:hypothetical protein